MKQILVKTIDEATWLQESGQLWCQHNGEIETIVDEVTFYQGDNDCSYNAEFDYCATCGESIEV